MIHREGFLGIALVAGVVCTCGSAIAVDRDSSDRRPGVVRTSRGDFDLTQGAPELAPAERSPLKLDERSRQYFIVACDPRKLGARGLDELRRRVVELGGEFVGELPVAAFLVRLTKRSYEYVVGQDGILAVEPYHAGFKLQSSV